MSTKREVAYYTSSSSEDETYIRRDQQKIKRKMFYKIEHALNTSSSGDDADIEPDSYFANWRNADGRLTDSSLRKVSSKDHSHHQASDLKS